MFEQVKAIIVDLLGADPDKVTMEARFREDLGADSLDLVELVMEFEEQFNKEISDEEAQNIKTVGDAVRFVEAEMAQ
jgi:acyl carrier protein